MYRKAWRENQEDISVPVEGEHAILTKANWKWKTVRKRQNNDHKNWVQQKK